MVNEEGMFEAYQQYESEGASISFEEWLVQLDPDEKELEYWANRCEGLRSMIFADWLAYVDSHNGRRPLNTSDCNPADLCERASDGSIIYCQRHYAELFDEYAELVDE